MYCPRCGQEQPNERTRFCSRCGFLMEGMAEIVGNGGLPKAFLDKQDPHAVSPRKRGLKQGALLFMSGFIIVPILTMITIMLDAEPFAVVISAVLTFLAGFLWMIYSLIFQSGVPELADEGIIDTIRQDLSGRIRNQETLPAGEPEPASADYAPPAGNWRETAGLGRGSVTEETTRTLDEKTFPQKN